MSSLPLQFLILTLAGWMMRDQHRVTEYLLAENAVLRQQLRGRRIRSLCSITSPSMGWCGFNEMHVSRMTAANGCDVHAKRYLIMDRDPPFTTAFRTLLFGSGVKSVRLPARSPNLNAFAERFVRSVREECLSKVVPLGVPHLREVLHQYVAHYHAERNHQGLANALIENDKSATTGRIARRKRIGGVLNFYYRTAA
jgi:transposase InsO family protein